MTCHGWTLEGLMETNATASYYSTVVPWYDAELADRGDVPCWLALMQAWKPRRTLEYGCGTGRVAIPLACQCAAWEGVVEGIDLSPEMLRLGAQRWRQERGSVPAGALRLYQGDMCRTAVSHRVDMVLFADDPLTHLDSDADLAATFRLTGEQLRPGGHLVVEASLLPPECRGYSHTVVLRSHHSIGVGDAAIEVEQERHINPARRCAVVTYRYRSRCGGEQHGPWQEARFLAHYLDAAHIVSLFSLAGCRVEERWADFQFHPLTSDSGTALYVGTRR